MKAALLIVLSLSAMAFAGPAFNKNNQINQQQQQQQQQQTYLSADGVKSPAVDILKQWCFSSQMSQQELTASFKKLVQVVKSSPVETTTESAVMSERICAGALVQKSAQTGSTIASTQADAKAHELIKDVYMDALISCKSRECTQQLLKVISSQQVDTIRAAYYMTRIAVSDKQSLKDEQEIKQFADSFVTEQHQQQQQQSEAVERQKLFATTALIGKWAATKSSSEQTEIKQIAEQVVKTIVERYIKPVSEQELEQYKQQAEQQQQQQQPELAKKIAKRSAALKALANIPGHVLKQIASAQELEQLIVKIAKDERELPTVRQSAIECLEQNDKQKDVLKELTFDQQQPIEVRVAAYRALMTVAYNKDNNDEEQMAEEIVEQLVKHCEQNQQTDEQFVLYVVSHLDNVRTSQQPEVRAIKQVIAKNKQHYMQVQVLAKKLAQKLADVRSSSRNYKLEQEFDQINSGLIIEGDLIYESKHKQQQQQQQMHILPKLIRVNMSMPIMGESVNVVEVTVRQNQMDESILSALKLAQSAKFNSESVAKVVDSFKASVEKQQQTYTKTSTKTGPVEADLTIKVDGCTVVYMCVDDIKAFKPINSNSNTEQHQRNPRSAYSQSIVDDIVEFLKRQPINFNRGFNVNINERLAKVLDVDANILAGLRFESRAQGNAQNGDFEITMQMEPRFSFEAIVGPASTKLSSKKLLQRMSTKSALGLRLRFKRDELVDLSVELPMNNMELFTVETQLVEKNTKSTPYSYNYLPESIYGDEDIYSPVDYTQGAKMIAKRSIFGQQKKHSSKSFAHTYETSEQVARATGLRGKLRVVAAPSELSFLVAAHVQKVEPQMQGFRVKIEKSQRAGEQYLVSVSCPNSRIQRAIEMRFVKQLSSTRSVVKCEISQSPFTSGPVSASLELVHDGRQLAIKTDLSCQGRKQWRHTLDAGLVTVSQSSAGRLAQFAYKPYVQIESTSMKRPIAIQGQLAYVQSPKSVISYELKCATTGDFVQGKLIVEQRDIKSSMTRGRRSMRSPIELLLEKDLTFTNEIVAQIQQHAVKVHNMAEWSCQQFALKGDSQVVYKNLRMSSQESRLVATMKLDQEQQVFQLERKSPADARQNFAYRFVSLVRPTGHQMELECRYHNQQALKAYKHKIDIVKIANKKYDAKIELELVDSERALNEKFVGRARISTERSLKTIDAELQARNKSVKLNFDFASLAKHQLVASVETERFSHKCELRNNERQFFVQSRTSSKQSQQMLAKLMLECSKPELEAKLVVECPRQQLAIGADLKLKSGQRSSLALKTGRFASQVEFSFENYARQGNNFMSRFVSSTVPSTMRFRSNIKDLVNKQSYWMDSELNRDTDSASFVRLDSPIYRTDVEFSPRDQELKMGAFARTKRSVDHYDSPLYSTKESSIFGLTGNTQSILNQVEQLKLTPNKMWMLRSIVASPYAREALKQKARRALFEYADRRQSSRHSINWSPEEERVSMDFARSPSTEFGSRFEPMRAQAELSTSWSRPSTMSLESQWMDASAELRPFDTETEESYAKVSALSRHPRSAFKKHDSEFRYSKRDGYKAHVKHQDAEQREHKFQLEADAEPRQFAKMTFESDKHGKTNWEHQWRKQQQKRSEDNEQIYANKFELKSEGPSGKKWQHETRFDWQEPIRKQHRERRSYQLNDDKYSPIEYLKHTNGRLVSSTRRSQDQQPMYKLDFDYKPQMNLARLNVEMPEDQMIHSSEFQYKPSESLYKLASKTYNRVNNEPSYEFALTSKPFGLATSEQEPMFFAHEHEMYERPISKQSIAYQLFKQPMKLDYSDKFGRQASLDYDVSPMTVAIQNNNKQFLGLRQKRAAVYYKDQSADIEHSTSYDFYPESYMAKMKPSYYKQQQQQQQQLFQQQPEVAFKTQTKYGPVVVRADSNESVRMVAIESPLMNAKLSAETFGSEPSTMRQLVKLQLDNKSQRVQMVKLMRDSCLPEIVRELKVVKKFARKFDSGRFEHQSELLVSLVESIFKIKSVSKFNERPIVVIEGEWNAQQDKAQLKINGERIEGHAIIDLVRKNAELVLDVDQKQTMHHVTRLVRTSDKFYSLESTTSCKSRPVFKLIGKVSAKVFDMEHLFSQRQQHYANTQQQEEHMSTFEAVVYEPKELHVSGQFDCDKKEARVVFKNVDEQRIQETLVRFDVPTETIFFDSRLMGQHEGQIYVTKAKLNLPGLYQSNQCRGIFNGEQQQQQQKFNIYNKMSTRVAGQQSCQSEMIYADKSGNWAAKYAPGEYVTLESPRAKQTINLANYYHQY